MLYEDEREQATMLQEQVNFHRAQPNKHVTLPEIGDDYTDEEELEWETLFAQPHVQAGLDRLAEEAERQFAAGETVEGGFALAFHCS
jgi:hypothetical protein